MSRVFTLTSKLFGDEGDHFDFIRFYLLARELLTIREPRRTRPERRFSGNAMSKLRLLPTALVMAGLTLGTAAMAQSTWNLYNGSANNREGVTSGCSQGATNAGSFGNSWNCTVGATGPTQQKVTASAWSSNDDRGTVGGVKGTVNDSNTNTSSFYGGGYALSGSGFASALMSDQGLSGFGGTSRLEAQTARAGGDTSPLAPGSPNHSFDSIAPGSFDMMLLDFGSSSVVLDKIGIGWTNGNADVTVLRWTGSSRPTGVDGSSSDTTDGHGNLLSTMYNAATPGTAGWQLVGSYADLTTDNTTPFGYDARNTGATQASSWWLISAFNTSLNGGNSSCLAANGSSTTCSATSNGFKLNFIATKPNGGGGGSGSGVPEPTSLALAGVALAGLIGARRRAAKQA
jgi:hypothetical protein